MNKGPAYFKALKVIDSCTSEDHFDATREYLDNFFITASFGADLFSFSISFK